MGRYSYVPVQTSSYRCPICTRAFSNRNGQSNISGPTTDANTSVLQPPDAATDAKKLEAKRAKKARQKQRRQALFPRLLKMVEEHGVDYVLGQGASSQDNSPTTGSQGSAQHPVATSVPIPPDPAEVDKISYISINQLLNEEEKDSPDDAVVEIEEAEDEDAEDDDSKSESDSEFGSPR